MAKPEIKPGDSFSLEALLWVEILEAQPNPMFTEAMRSSVRFLRFNRHVPCVHCKKKRRIMWTMLCEFRVSDLGIVTAIPSKTVYPPLTPVCQDHPIGPDMERATVHIGKRTKVAPPPKP